MALVDERAQDVLSRIDEVTRSIDTIKKQEGGETMEQRVAPGDVLGDNVCKLKGLIGVLCTLAGNKPGDTPEIIDPKDFSWTLIVMSELATEIQTDLKALDDDFDAAEEPKETV